ncbi:DUF397 domain-containing protein [Streptomyces sp. NPDC088816]|uniref:DUF397 domain-containing protein n=1 Tax=Streptomyces sp. NPDC088816 TaxID=3365906 RepID=UPI00381C187B
MSRKASARGTSDLVWFKSSYSSGAETDSCVEIATDLSTVHVRDSKHVDGPRLAMTPGAWAHFVSYAAED